jgi:RNA 3'-terminal phosphate cyclase (ATP)
MVSSEIKEVMAIDGSLGEGGGQVLRSSLALALLTGRPFAMKNIRQRRAKPGLMAQHLKAVEAASAVGAARVEGARLGSQNLVFEPAGIQSGEFHLDIGTAGSISLVLQTVLLPLSFANEHSAITLIGGTHVPWSPCFHYLDWQWLHYMRQIGFRGQLALEAAGFYPRGGGRVRAIVQPASTLAPLRLTDRGPLKRIRGISGVANLHASVAERQKHRAIEGLSGVHESIEIETVRLSSPSKGTFLLLLAEFEKSQCCFYGLGAVHKSAEHVADEAVGEMLDFLGTDGSVDYYLADQLVLPLALVSGVSEVRTSRVTQHLVTNAEIVKMFLPVAIEIDAEIGRPGLIRIRGAKLPA